MKINRLEIKRIIKADLNRFNGQKSIRKALFSPSFQFTGFKFLYFWRKASHSNNKLGKLLYKIIVRRLSYKYGFQIPIGTQIGSGFYIGHFGTIVINGSTKIGKNCNIAHGVTIGRSNRGKFKGSPEIGNHVWIGTGSVLVGKISIGNNVLIAPNAYVNVDVPDNSIVIGNPAQIKSKDNPTEGYINHTIE